jgi:hypothetical protein
MEPEDSPTFPEEPDTELYLETDKSTLYFYILIGNANTDSELSENKHSQNLICP